MSINLSSSASSTPSTLAEDFGSSGASPSLTLTDTTASAEDYTLTADADKLTITSSAGAGGAEVVVDGKLNTTTELAVYGSGTPTLDLMNVAGTSGLRTSFNGTATTTMTSFSSGTAGNTLTFIGGSELVVNESGADRDFRVEGDTDANLLFVDASTDTVGVGIATPDSKAHIYGGSAGAVTAHAQSVLTVEGSGNNGISILTPASAVGVIMFGSPTSNLRGEYYYAHSTDSMHFKTAGTERLSLAPAATVFNETGADTDLRMESGTNANMFYLDAGNNRIGVGTSGPDVMLHAYGGDSSQTASSDMQICAEGSGNSGIQILSGSAAVGSVLFGDSGSVSAGYFQYNHATDEMKVAANGGVLLTIGSGGVTVNSNYFVITTSSTPASAAASGTAGQIAWDASYVYVCTATNTWKRAAIATW